MRKSSKKRPFTIRFFNTVEPVAPLYRDLIPYWIARGWQVEVVMSRAEYRAGTEKEWLKEGVKIRWTPGFGLKAYKKFAKFLLMAAYIITTAFKSLFGPSVDRNLFLTQPPLFFVWGFILKKLRKQPYIIVLMDLYPDVAIQAKLLKADSFMAKLLTRISRFGLYKADSVIAIGRCMKQRLLNYGVAEKRIRLIPNWTNPENILPIPNEENSFRREKGWNNKFVILYSGNIGISHYFDDILKVSLLLRKKPDILFVFVGYGQRLQEIELFKKEHGLNNIELMPFQDRDILSLSLSAGDIHFVSLRAGFEGLVVPSKTYGIFAVGRPVIYQGDPRGEIATLITEEDVGRIVEIDNPDQLEEAILSYAEDPLLAHDQGVKARLLAGTKYHSRLACEKYTQALNLSSDTRGLF
ncbi:glycosyltransferase family 4 protein [Acidobacteriota bacterium]